MVARTLQWIGLAAILCLFGAGVAALMLVKDRVHVTIHDSDPAATADPLALVRDELQQLHSDLESITKALRQNLEEIARQLNNQATAQGELRTKFDAARQNEDLTALRTDLRRIESAITSLQGGRTSTIATQPPTEERPKQADPVAKPEPEKPATAKKETRKPVGFLSFQLPSKAFTFDRCQKYRILGDLSRVGFDAKSTLHDFTGATTKVRGDFQANLAGGEGRWQGTVAITAAALGTGIDERDAGMWERLGTKQFRDITFELTGFTPEKAKVDVKARRSAGTVTGKMTIRGKTNAVKLPVQIEVDASRRVSIRGAMQLQLSDYGVEAPNQLGLITMQDEVRVWIALRARRTGDCR